MYPAAILDYAPEHLHSVLQVSHAALPPGYKLQQVARSTGLCVMVDNWGNVVIKP